MDLEKLFFWGYPSSVTEPHLGLWEPVTSRFLLTLNHVDKAQTMRMIASSRYNLFVCDLRSANNYQPNLIDNSCCENWTVGSKQGLMVSKPYKFNHTVEIQNLVPVEVPGPACDHEKSWLLLCYHWLGILEKFKQEDWYVQDRFIKKIFSTELSRHGADYFDKIDQVENYILKTLYLGQDLDQINHSIESYITDLDSVLAHRLSIFNS